MSEMQCCPLQTSGDYDAQFHAVAVRKARRDYRCVECHGTISNGALHEYVTGKWDGAFSTYRTCMLCVEIRKHFACGSWIYGQLWSDLEENFFPDMKAGGPCMEGLSPVAKARLFERRLKWMEE